MIIGSKSSTSRTSRKFGPGRPRRGERRVHKKRTISRTSQESILKGLKISKETMRKNGLSLNTSGTSLSVDSISFDLPNRPQFLEDGTLLQTSQKSFVSFSGFQYDTFLDGECVSRTSMSRSTGSPRPGRPIKGERRAHVKKYKASSYRALYSNRPGISKESVKTNDLSLDSNETSSIAFGVQCMTSSRQDQEDSLRSGPGSQSSIQGNIKSLEGERSGKGGKRVPSTPISSLVLRSSRTRLSKDSVRTNDLSLISGDMKSNSQGMYFANWEIYFQ